MSPQDFVPSFEENGKRIHPDDFERYITSFEHCFQTGKPSDLDVRLIAGDGQVKYCNAKGKILYDDSGQPLRFVGTIIDITERKKLEAAFLQIAQAVKGLFSRFICL
ncbi:MAG: PAS domain-containing protein [Proteobacteria bacterium]|nr:PAS domain-containing protein [Pseudomonadota bacterium]